MKGFFTSQKRMKTAFAGLLSTLGALGISWASDIDPVIMASAIGSIAAIVSVYIPSQTSSDKVAGTGTKGAGQAE